MIYYTCISNIIFRFKSSEWAHWIFIEICNKGQKPEIMNICPVLKLTHILYDKWSQYLFSKIISFRRYLYLCIYIIVCSNTLEISVTCKCITARCNHLKEKCHSKTVIAWSLTLHYLHYARSDSLVNYLSKILFYKQITYPTKQISNSNKTSEHITYLSAQIVIRPSE